MKKFVSSIDETFFIKEVKMQKKTCLSIKDKFLIMFDHKGQTVKPPAMQV